VIWVITGLFKYSLDGSYLGSFGTPCPLNPPEIHLLFVRRTLLYPKGNLTNRAVLTTDSSGNIYVVDVYNHRVQVFTNAGVPVRTFGSLGTDPDEFTFPKDVKWKVMVIL